jgi:hypothetical protein
VSIVEPADFWQIRRNNRKTHGQVLVEFCRIHVCGVVAQAIGHDPHVKSLQIAREVRVRPRTEHMNIGLLLQ